MMEERYSMKDDYFNSETARLVTDSLVNVWPEFDEAGCYKEIVQGFEGLELKERMTHIRLCLEKYLTEDYRKNVGILSKALASLEEGHFVFGAFCEYVESNGCNDVHVDLSLTCLGEFTKKFSAEFAIRRFINVYPEKTYRAMMVWSKSQDTDQKRLASEGLRPKLPWAKGITFDYKEGVRPLDHLYLDAERYVTRSVANHLNDVSKMDPVLVISILRRWLEEGKQDPKEMAYIISHSTRTLVKQGYKPALELLGYEHAPNIEIEGFEVQTQAIQIGESLIFSFDLISKEDCKLMVDYSIEYPMANDKRLSKVFKIKKLKMTEGEKREIIKKHPFKVMTTKKLYSGMYKITLQINGGIYNEGEFYLEV